MVVTTGKATGRALRRVEDPRFLAGQGHFVEDVQPQGVLHLVFVRSPYPNARLTSVDVEAARQSPGVVAVLTAADLADVGDVPCIPLPFAKVPPYPPLARGHVSAVGTPIVAIVAESSAAAHDAVDLVEIEYEPQPAVSYAETALEPNAPKVHPELDSNLCYTLKKAGGDVDLAFRGADVTVKVRVDSPRVAPVALEPRSVVAEPGAADSPTRLTVWITSQAPHGARADLARVLGLQPDDIRVISPDVGGGFGAKSGATPEYIVACSLALRLGRAVKWVASRGEDMQVTTQGRDMLIYVELAAKRDGTVTGLKLRNIANMGAYLHSATAIPPTFILNMGGGCYRISNVEVETNAVFTNTPPTGPYRGAGRPESVLAIERGMDALAQELGMDPIELRRKNFIQPDEFPYTVALGAVYDSGDYGRALDKALNLANYADLVAQRDAARRSGELMGIGISTFVEPCGSVGGETGLVRVEADGRVTLVTGSHSHGQGHETSFAQVVADQMQVPMQEVRVVHGDTAAIGSGVGTFASRSMTLGGSAAVGAATKVIDKARRIAAHVLEATIEDVEHVDGGFAVAGAPSRRVTWQEIARVAYAPGQMANGEEAGLEATDRFDLPGDLWPFGTHLAVVRVDAETGDIKIEQVVAVDDCGNVVNPLIVEGQVQGGMAQAVGQAMLERVVFDEQGQMLSGSLGDYAIPRAGDMPPMLLDHTVTPSPLNPLGAKGVGEAGTNGLPPAIANAVMDALSPLGVRHLDLPFTADRVWQAMQDAARDRMT
ncbi:MAG TPA: xanthine dehydrogenase family protein molybdopterin-binding subunit [Chloroflexota bacterium]|nr:xanthine dehydrogenase family protein molybdopterin-binding subunit [Chloroflexota bacterium]